MVVGAGVPILWPYPVLFHFVQLESKSVAEMVFAGLLVCGAVGSICRARCDAESDNGRFPKRKTRQANGRSHTGNV